MKLGLLPLASVIALALVAGCSSSASEPAPEASEDALGTQGQADGSLKGAFSVVLDRHTVKFKFTMDQVDLREKTVRWNAQITDRGGNAQAFDDKNEPGKIVDVARCPGCYTAEIPGGSGKLARVVVRDFKVTSIVYEGVEARLIEATDSTAPTSAGGAESPDDRGACKLNGGNCKELARSECKAGPLYPQMRCCMNFTFEEGESCN